MQSATFKGRPHAVVSPLVRCLCILFLVSYSCLCSLVFACVVIKHKCHTLRRGGTTQVDGAFYGFSGFSTREKLRRQKERKKRKPRSTMGLARSQPKGYVHWFNYVWHRGGGPETRGRAPPPRRVPGACAATWTENVPTSTQPTQPTA